MPPQSMPNLSTEELHAASTLAADGLYLSTLMEEGMSPQLFLSLLTVFNHAQILRSLDHAAAQPTDRARSTPKDPHAMAV